jgi:predicted glutamine amidotransferase
MARLIGYMANRADRLRDAFHQERVAIARTPTDQSGAWGVGFYQGDEVLHKKQPTPDGQPVDWDSIVQNIKSDCAIAHVRQATVGAFSVDNTNPFRFRQWLFAHVGTMTAFDEVKDELLASVPDFLRRNVRGRSDSELLFHLVLGELHEASQLEALTPTSESVVGAIHKTLRKVDEVVGSARPTSTLNLIIGNGQMLVGARHGGAFGWVERTGLTDLAAGSMEETARPGSPLLRYVMLVSGATEVPEGYTALDDKHAVEVTRGLEVRQHQL